MAVTDDEGARAMRLAVEELRLVVKPGGCVALAALLEGHLRLQGQSAVIVLSGGNIDVPVLTSVLYDA